MAVTPFKSSDNFNMAGFNEKITEADNTYVAKTGGGMSGALSMGNNKITDVASPVNDGDVATKGYVDGFARYKIGTYTGNGNAKKTITVGFSPVFIIIMPMGVSDTDFNGVQYNNDGSFLRGIIATKPLKYTNHGRAAEDYSTITWGKTSIAIQSRQDPSRIGVNINNQQYIYMVLG